MKKILLTLSLVSFTACSTLSPKPETLKASPQCQVWKKNMVGLNVVAELNEKEETSRKQMTCWVAGMFLCSYNKYSFDPNNKTQIISNVLGKVATLEGNKMNFKITGAQSDPFVISGGHVEYEYTAPMGPKRHSSVDYNDKCSTKMVALGIMALVGDY